MTYDPTYTGPRTRVMLQPLAAPSILGLYGFAGATFMVAANMAHWFGSPESVLTLVPFAAIFGGLAQFLAGMWAFKARDAVATAMHGMWGSFWMAYGALIVLFAIQRTAPPEGVEAGIGYWFIVLAAITWVGAAASMAESNVVSAVLVFLAAGSTCAAIGNLIGSEPVRMLAGWLFIISAFIAWYAASALMLNEVFGRVVWPLGARSTPLVATGAGEPGVIRGQA